MDKKNKVKRIFDSIAGRYDLLNHLLSAGMDFYWRKRALKLTKINTESVILDMACGTGDFSIAAGKLGTNKIIGADYSYEMIKNFCSKAAWSKGRIVQTVAEAPPFKNSCFTNIIIGFGVRNFYNIQTAFDNFYSLLTLGGKVTILEFRLPPQKIFQLVYNFYFTRVLPLVGKIISKDPEAYTYLPESVHEFDRKINLPELLKNSGFENIESHSLTAGIVQVVIAFKK